MVKRVTMPKLPPPPRSAQNSSGCESADTSITSPLARTSSRETKLSQVSPCLRENQPMPPPRASPPTPVSDMMPAGTTSRCGAVAASTSPSRHPPPTWTSLCSASTVTSRSPLRSMVRPPSDLALPRPVGPAAADARREAVLAGHGDRGHHIRGARAAQDEARPPVDHGVPDRAGLLVLGVVGADDVALELPGQLLGDAQTQLLVDARPTHAGTSAPSTRRRMAFRVAATALR